MADDKTEVTLPRGFDQEKRAKNQALIDAAKAKAPPPGHVPSPPMPDFKALSDNRGATPTAPGMAPYKKEDYERLVREGRAIPGVGGAFPAAQAASQGRAPDPDQEANHEAAVHGLEALAAANQGRPVSAAEPPEEIVSKNADVEPPAPSDEAEDSTSNLDALDNLPKDSFAALMAQLKSRQQDDQRRRDIASRCTPMALEDVLLSQDATQRVPVVPGKFEPTFRVLNGHEDAFVKNYSWARTTSSSSDIYYQTLLSMTSTCLALVALNGKPLIEVRDEKGRMDEKKVEEKMDFVLRYPMPVLADLAVNYVWFEDRVRELLNFEAVKNG